MPSAVQSWRSWYSNLNAATSHSKIMVRTVDTVSLLALSQMHTIPEKELWVAFGMGKQFRYYPVHEISRSLGPQKSLVLPVFHAFNRLWYCVFFAGKSKKSAWNTCVSRHYPFFLWDYVCAQSAICRCTNKIESFVILLYDRGSQLVNWWGPKTAILRKIS